MWLCGNTSEKVPTTTLNNLLRKDEIQSQSSSPNCSRSMIEFSAGVFVYFDLK
jgi:hypothetical protein